MILTAPAPTSADPQPRPASSTAFVRRHIGVGPVAVAAHLVPHLPGHHAHPDESHHGTGGAVSGAPCGSAGILPLVGACTAMMGPDGLRSATEIAVLSADCFAARLGEHHPVLHTGSTGLVAHECTIDLRPLTAATGRRRRRAAHRRRLPRPDDVLPVAGTLMIEPTESGGLAEADRSSDVMIAIRGEVAEIAADAVAVQDSALRHAPHTTADVVGDRQRRDTRGQGAFPTGLGAGEHRPPVALIQQACGDRDLVCSRPAPEASAAASTVPSASEGA